MKKELESNIGKFTDDYINQKLTEYNNLIYGMSGENIQLEVLRDVLSEANGYINLLCGNDRKMYTQNRFHLIVEEDGYFRVSRGWEINTDPGADAGP